jgi:pyrroloquinoline-quinone synthase
MWIKLGEALGVPREEMEDEAACASGRSLRHRGAVTFCKTKPWIEERRLVAHGLFAPRSDAQAIAAFPQHYAWVRPEALEYFKSRLTQAPRDASMDCTSCRRGALLRQAQRKRSRRWRSSSNCCG